MTPDAHRSVPFKTRLVVYLGLWALAVVAFEIFLTPDGLTETDWSELHQRIMWLLLAPWMALGGFAMYFLDWSRVHSQLQAQPSGIAIGISLSSYAILAILILKNNRRWLFWICCAIQAVILAISIVYLIRSDNLPSGFGTNPPPEPTHGADALESALHRGDDWNPLKRLVISRGEGAETATG